MATALPVYLQWRKCFSDGQHRRSMPDQDILGSARRCNLRAPTRECSIRLMEDQFIHFLVRTEMELDPEALELVDDKGSALVPTEFVGWLAPIPQRELSVVVPSATTVITPWLSEQAHR
jgi:hypothetical protein